MAHVRYNESLYRTGFRPQGTNAHAAANLAGPINHSWGGFGPYTLHGDPIFTPRGGYTLHGLGDAGIPAGSIFTYKGTWTSVFNTGAGYKQAGDPDSLIKGVTDALNSDGQLTVLQFPHGVTGILNALGGGPFNVTLVVQVTNGQGFGSVNDAISIIRHYVYQVSGQMPVSDSITQIKAPGAAGSTDPNYQGAGLVSPGGVDASAMGAEDWGTWLQDNFALIAGLAAALVIVPPLLKKVF